MLRKVRIFDMTMKLLTTQLVELLTRGNELHSRIRQNLKGIDYEF
jgi:hypothetical protein